jgi:hypothetical protein
VANRATSTNTPEAYHLVVALLLILLSLFGFVFAGFSSGSGHSSSPQQFQPTGKTHVQKSVTRSRVTVHSSVTAKSSASCTARVRIKGASVQTSRHCRYSPVSP